MYTLLILDDEHLVRKGIQTFVQFDELGINQVFEAGDGEEGLRLFSLHLPDFVLLDINMPKMNGLDFAKQAKLLKPNVKIAVITGYDYYDYAVKALKIGIDDYVLKPVSRTDIQRVLFELVLKRKEDERLHEAMELMEEWKVKNKGYESVGYKSSIEKLVEEHYEDSSFSLSFLAEKMGLSVAYCSSLFKQLFGISFQEHLGERRLEKGKLLLLTTNHKIYEISNLVGFEDPNYFSTAFKKRFGCSPNQYKERVIKQ